MPEELAWATTDYLYDITQEYYQVISETRTETNGHTATTAYAYGLERIAAYTADSKTSYVYDGRGSVAQAVTAPVAGERYPLPAGCYCEGAVFLVYRFRRADEHAEGERLCL